MKRKIASIWRKVASRHCHKQIVVTSIENWISKCNNCWKSSILYSWTYENHKVKNTSRTLIAVFSISKRLLLSMFKKKKYGYNIFFLGFCFFFNFYSIDLHWFIYKWRVERIHRVPWRMVWNLFIFVVKRALPLLSLDI